MKVIVLNLYKSYERRASIASQLDAQKIEHSFFYGIDNKAFNLEKSGLRIAPGAIGAFIGHISIMQMALRTKENMIVLEDDVTIPPGFMTKITAALDLLPADWDLAFLGWSVAMKGKIKEIDNPKWMKVESHLGCYGYVINGEKVPKILSALNNVEHHIDKQLSKMIATGRLNGYFCKDQLVLHESKFPSLIPK